MIFTDRVIKQITGTVGAYEPETGGALFGPRYSRVLTDFYFDERAEVTNFVYVPSENLVSKVVPAFEKKKGLEFKGFVHSHPEGVFNPSFGDHGAVSNTLAGNPHLASMFFPILTFTKPRSPRLNTLDVGSGAILNVFEGQRDANGVEGVFFEEVRARIMNVSEPMKELAKAIDTDWEKGGKYRTGTRMLNNVVCVREHLSWENFILDVYFTDSYPATGPIVCLRVNGADEMEKSNWLYVPWEFNDHRQDALVETLRGPLGDRGVEFH